MQEAAVPEKYVENTLKIAVPLAPQNADKICFLAGDSLCDQLIVIFVHNSTRGV